MSCQDKQHLHLCWVLLQVEYMQIYIPLDWFWFVFLALQMEVGK